MSNPPQNQSHAKQMEHRTAPGPWDLLAWTGLTRKSKSFTQWIAISRKLLIGLSRKAICWASTSVGGTKTGGRIRVKRGLATAYIELCPRVRYPSCKDQCPHQHDSHWLRETMVREVGATWVTLADKQKQMDGTDDTNNIDNTADALKLPFKNKLSNRTLRIRLTTPKSNEVSPPFMNKCILIMIKVVWHSLTPWQNREKNTYLLLFLLDVNAILSENIKHVIWVRHHWPHY